MNDLLIYSIMDLLLKFKKKEFQILDVLMFYEERIRKLDQTRGGYQSVRSLDKDSLLIAKNLWESYQQNHSLSLYGIPLLVKDNIDVKGMVTSAGSIALSDNMCMKDSKVIENLKAQGAVIFGKTNMTEFANYMSDHMPGGYSSYGGQVLCAYDKSESPWGSSTGSAVAVSANLCAGAIGTDTSNSIVAVSMRNGIVGYKPPYHSLSQEGIVPISFTLDSAGPMTRKVEDAILLYEVMKGESPKNWKVESLRGKKIAVNVWNRKLLSEEYNQAIDEFVKKLNKHGVTVSNVNLPASENLKKIMKYEFKYGINQYLTESKAKIRSLDQLVDYNERHREEALRYGQIYLTEALQKTTGDMSESEYKNIMLERKKIMEDKTEVLKGYDACLMCAPNNLSHYLGFASISLPHGLDKKGMPVGFIMTGVEEERLLRTALSMEAHVLKGYVSPPM